MNRSIPLSVLVGVAIVVQAFVTMGQSTELRLARAAVASPISGAQTAAAPASGGSREAVSEPLEGIPVLIVDGRTGERIAGAEVRWFVEEAEEVVPGTFDWGVLDEPRDRASLDDQAARTGRVAYSDSAGVVHIPLTDEITTVVARADMRWGYGQQWVWPGDDSQRTIEIWPDGDVVVVVLDDQGTPVSGVSVALRSDWTYAFRDYLRATTDESGVANLRHAGQCMQEWRSTTSSMVEETSWYVTTRLCLGTDVRATIDSRAFPSEPVRLTLPPTGSVTVELRTDEGYGVDVDMPVMLVEATEEILEAIREDARYVWMETMNGGAPARNMLAEASAGRAVFNQVGLNQAVVAYARRNEASGTFHVLGSGPSEPGGESRLEIVIGRDRPIFTARLVDESGAPLASRLMLFQLFSGPSPDRVRFMNRFEADYIGAGHSGLRTDAQGRLTFDLRLDAAHGGRPLLVLTHELNTPGSRSALVDLSPHWRPGLQDLGDITLPAAPVLASGRVVDERGDPVAGASVSVMVFKGSPYIETTSDALGRFYLRSAKPDKEVSISADLDGRARVYLRNLQSGREDLEVVLVTAGEVEGTLLPPPGLDPGDLTVSMVMTAYSGEGVAPNVHGGLRDDWTFAYPDFPPGTYAIRVLQHGRVLDEREIVLHAGEKKQVTIDLRGSTRPIVLTIFDFDGALVDAGRYYVLPAEGADPDQVPWDRPEFRGGRIEVVVPSGTADIDISAPGYRTEHLRAVYTDREVTLRPGLPVTLRLDPPVGPPPDGWQFLARVCPTNGPKHGMMRDDLFAEAPYDLARGEAILLVPEPGRYVVHWMLRKSQPGGWSGKSWQDDEHPIEVKDDSQPQSFALAPIVDPSEIDPDD